MYRYSLTAKKWDENIAVVKMVYLEGICMVGADTHVVWDQFNTEGPMGPAFCACGRTTIQRCEVVIRGHFSCVIFCFDINSQGPVKDTT